MCFHEQWVSEPQADMSVCMSKFMNNVFKKYCGLQALRPGTLVCMSYFMNSVFESWLWSLSPKQARQRVCISSFTHIGIYYPPEVRRGKYWRLGVFLLQYFPLVKISKLFH